MSGNIWGTVDGNQLSFVISMKTLAESLEDERDAVHRTFNSPDQIEGIKAFLEKRKPIFNHG